MAEYKFIAPIPLGSLRFLPQKRHIPNPHPHFQRKNERMPTPLATGILPWHPFVFTPENAVFPKPELIHSPIKFTAIESGPMPAPP
jgi:hypothetical protein